MSSLEWILKYDADCALQSAGLKLKALQEELSMQLC